MVSQEYSEAIAETLDILEHTQEADVNRIPKKFMDFLKENTSKTYKPNLDYTKRIKDMNLKDKTIGILSVINKKYWCNDEERKVFEEKLKQNEIKYQKELNEKYDKNKLFKNKELKKVENTNITDLAEYTEQKWYQRILEKILKVVRKN